MAVKSIVPPRSLSLTACIETTQSVLPQARRKAHHCRQSEWRTSSSDFLVSGSGRFGKTMKPTQLEWSQLLVGRHLVFVIAASMPYGLDHELVRLRLTRTHPDTSYSSWPNNERCI